MTELHEKKGPIAWMAKNPVAANLLMVFLILGGFLTSLRIKQEVFPDLSLEVVQIVVPYPGASPEEVEKGIIKVVEEEVRGLDGIERVTATASEGFGSILVKLLVGTDENKALQDVKNAVDRIVTFPEDAERPQVSLLSRRREAISLVVYGDLEEGALRRLAEQIRDELLAHEGITLVDLTGVRPLEIHVEIPQETLRKYKLTLGEVAAKIRRTALELPGGGVKTQGGEILLRLAERRDTGADFASIPILSDQDGTEVLLGDIAKIVDGFRETDEASSFNGKPAAKLMVYRTGDQTPIEVADIVKEYTKRVDETLPEGAGIAIWRDWSDVYRQRLSLLLRNACLGLVLVMVLLGMFLEVRLAFWVTMGIPTSFLGAMLLLPGYDISMNMISMFAFIMSLGMVVDDAIVVGENIYEMRQRGVSGAAAAIAGARQVAMPVTFSVLTNVAAFMPMFFVAGVMGKIFRVIPAVVVSVFFISLVECMFILPAHLSHQRKPAQHGVRAALGRLHALPGRGMRWFIDRVYAPVQLCALRWRYVTMAIGVALLATVVAFFMSGRIAFRFMPLVESEMIQARVVLPYGSPWQRTQKVAAHLKAAAEEELEEHGGDAITKGIYSRVTGHIAEVVVSLVPADEREITATRFAALWRERTGDVPGIELLTFNANIHGPSAGAAIDVELSHADIGTLERAASDLAEHLENYAGVKDIDDGFALGKPQLDFKIKPEAESLRLTAADLGRQVRDCFYGAEALRQQRGRDEIRVMVRLPEAERRTEHTIENLIIRTPAGGEVLFAEAAEITRGRAYTEIKRVDGRRSVNVTADVMRGAGDPGKILDDINETYLPQLMVNYPGLSREFAGEMRERKLSMDGLIQGFMVALIVIYAMLAIPFNSFVQPLIVMAVIPFGIVGAVAGHVIMGYDLSIISMFGIVALAGVVVNDSLVLIDAANKKRLETDSEFEAISYAGKRRFRPIVLTSITTFLGLTPMIFETSIQARFLIPMAISLGYGILFATLIALLLVPSLYLIVEDLRRAARWIFPAK